MAKDMPKTEPKTTETPFRRFEKLAKKIVRVPKNPKREGEGKRQP